MKQVNTFDDILGGQKLIAYMKETAANGTVPHALMLVGEEGSGKKMFANLYAKALLCENADAGEPCLRCQSCLQVAAGAHPDIVKIAPEEGKGKGRKSISVKTVRDTIGDGAFIKPYKGPYKIYIFERAELMTEEAQNALLKILEEPPSYIVIMLLSTNEESLLETVRSRCVIFHTAGVEDEQVTEYLQEYLMVPDYLARPAAAFARGNIGKAAALVSSQEFRQSYDQVIRCFKKGRHAEYDQIVENVQEIVKNTDAVDRFLELAQLYLRDVLSVRIGEERELFFADEEEAVTKTAEALSFRDINTLEKQIFTVKERLEQNVAPDMAMEVLLAGIKEAFK